MMKNKDRPITVNEMHHFAIIHIASLLVIIVFLFFFSMDIGDLKDMKALSIDVILEIFMIISISIVNVRLFKKWRIVRIDSKTIQSFSITKRKIASVNLTSNVYYCFENETLLLDTVTYMVVSNSDLSSEGLDSNRIKLLYTKQVQKLFPREEWIEKRDT